VWIVVPALDRACAGRNHRHHEQQSAVQVILLLCRQGARTRDRDLSRFR